MLTLASIPGHGASDSHTCVHAPEPTEEEFTGAVREATQALEEAANAINEILLELRIMQVELE